MSAYTPPARLAQALPGLRKAQRLLLALVAFTLPLPFKGFIWLNSVSSIVLLAVSLLLFAAAPWGRRWVGAQWWLPVLLLAYGAGLWQAIEWQPSWFEVEKKLSWPVYVLAFYLAPPSRPALEAAARWFLAGLVLILVIALLAAAVLYGRDGELNHFKGTWLLYPLGLHRVYTSLHLLVAALLVLAWSKQTTAKWVLFVVLVVAQLALASRTSVLTSGVLVVVGIFYLAYVRRYVAALYLSATLGALGGLMSQVSYVHNHMMGLKQVNEKAASALEENEGVPIRLVLWQSAWELIKERPLAGYGTGNDRILLPIKYREKGLEMAARDQYNAHNQYLQTWLETGLAGLLLLLAFLGTFFWASHRAGHWLPATLGLVLSMALLSECMLNAQKGSVFIAFLAACLLSYYLPHASSRVKVY